MDQKTQKNVFFDSNFFHMHRSSHELSNALLGVKIRCSIFEVRLFLKGLKFAWFFSFASQDFFGNRFLDNFNAVFIGKLSSFVCGVDRPILRQKIFLTIFYPLFLLGQKMVLRCMGLVFWGLDLWDLDLQGFIFESQNIGDQNFKFQIFGDWNFKFQIFGDWNFEDSTFGA